MKFPPVTIGYLLKSSGSLPSPGVPAHTGILKQIDSYSQLTPRGQTSVFAPELLKAMLSFVFINWTATQL